MIQRPSYHLTIPPETPAWITANLIRETLDTWQPYYDEELTLWDAIEILQNFGRLFDTLQEKI